VKNLQAVIERHVRACLEEVRGEIEAEIRTVIGALATGTREKAPARLAVSAGAKKAPKPQQKGSARQTRTGGVVSARPCGCGPVGRHRRECAGAQPPRTVERSPRVERAATTTDSPRVKAPIDVVKAERFARLEAAAAKRNGAAA
jgi:hypothetical protein